MTTIIRLSAMAFLAMAFAIPASAQNKIDALIQEILSSNKNVEVIYSEQRDPASRAITVSNHMITSTDEALFKRVYEAIQAERPNSTSYSQVGREVITITFTEGPTTHSYSLIRDEDDSEWMLSASNQPSRNQNTAVSRKRTQRSSRKNAPSAPDIEVTISSNSIS